MCGVGAGAAPAVAIIAGSHPTRLIVGLSFLVVGATAVAAVVPAVVVVAAAAAAGLGRNA